MDQNDTDIRFMDEAIKQARKAAEKDEVPIGAVVVYENEVIGRGHNLREASFDPTAHAEIIAIKEAAGKLRSWRMPRTTLYVTIEPCLMCMGAIIQARIPRLVFASFDPKAGACGSLYDLSNDTRLNHTVEVTSGVGSAEAEKVIKDFFARLRTDKKAQGK